jgi:hypothetical protein
MATHHLLVLVALALAGPVATSAALVILALVGPVAMSSALLAERPGKPPTDPVP